ncbi:lipoprotein-anchoring transpeptidase, ErfK/SrfK family [Aliarcobacter faecis]|uniref:L,D-transpeptidase n=1 Tax=Aliarcobacter faecis TaxID=1564138 RepID=UPI0004AF474D|nr:L,D-transpeptidase [Aliarcobacter faecis]QKF73900.1 lipoprotein-anchoring transpeptidase, ErfK/SrfK family [Aliarcobacter faecis]
MFRVLLLVLLMVSQLFSKESKESLIKIDEFIEKFSKIKVFDEDKFVEDFSKIGTKIIDKYTPKLSTFKKVDNILSETGSYDKIIIDVDSSTNILSVNAKVDDKLKLLKSYKVSTARKDIKKPLGVGEITSITLNPVWYPTADTIESFRKKGIILPKVVKGGDKLNYMGSAKINLSHKVDGKDTFRIHGTLSEKTIGSYESSGCIRMKNSEVVELVGLLKEFIEFKSMEDIKVVLK